MVWVLLWYWLWLSPVLTVFVVTANVQFVRVYLDDLPALGEKYRVPTLPYVIFIKKQSIEERLDNPSEERVEATLIRLVGGVAQLAALGGGHRLGTEPSPPQNNG
jgi:hypothetical protein